MIDDLIGAGWRYHDTESERLARELETADLGELDGEAPAHCLRLSNHTIGEHLGDWPRARRFAEAVCAADPNHLKIATVGAHLAVARYMDDADAAAQQAEIDCLGAAQDPLGTYLMVKSSLAGALAGTGRFADAGLVIGAANRLASGMDGPGSSARSMAIVNNNLASELVDHDDLDAEQARLMLACADAAHTFWKRCGTWVNEERALCLLALVNNRTGKFDLGLEYAGAALDVISGNGEEPVDEAFIRLAAAKAHVGLSDPARRDEEVARADALAATWSDESLVNEYSRDRARVTEALVPPATRQPDP